MQPEDASLCFGAGIAAFMLGQDDVAQSRFECALASTRVSCQRRCGSATCTTGQDVCREAISIYEAAAQRSPGARDLQKQLDELAQGARVAEPLSGSTDGALRRTLRDGRRRTTRSRGPERLEAAYRRIGDTLGVYPSEPITVVLYTREQFSDITRLAAWSAAAYDGRIRVPIGAALEQPDELDRVLSHEYVHAAVAMLGGRTVPAWLNEGLATVLEPASPADAEATLVLSRNGPHSQSCTAASSVFPARDAEIAYASAARAVRRLIERARHGGRRRAAGGSATRRGVCPRVPTAARDALRGFRGAGGSRLVSLSRRTSRPPSLSGPPRLDRALPRLATGLTLLLGQYHPGCVYGNFLLIVHKRRSRSVRCARLRFAHTTAAHFGFPWRLNRRSLRSEVFT